VKKNRYMNLIFLSLVFFLLMLFLTLSAMEDRMGSDDEKIPLAFWNQEEYDLAMHAIDQSRELHMDITVKDGKKPIDRTFFQVCTLRTPFEGGDECIEVKLDANGRFQGLIKYNHSLIDTTFDSRGIPPSCGIDTMSFIWYHPGKWFSSLIYVIDFSQFHVKEKLSAQKDKVEFSFSYPAYWIEKTVGVYFGDLYGISSDAEQEPQGRTDSEVIIKREEKGTCVVILNMKNFFLHWNDNYSTPYKAEDIYPVSVVFSIVPPEGFFKTTPSRRKDPSFVPRQYGGEVDSSDGDPFLSVPSIEPLKEGNIEIKRRIRVTGAMVE
jgi:hypothetical protein